MSGWQKIKTVATFEFLACVKRPGYLIATFGMPLFMAAYGGIVAIPAYYAQKSGREPAVYGVIDEAGVLRLRGDLAGRDAPRIRLECGAQRLGRVVEPRLGRAGRDPDRHGGLVHGHSEVVVKDDDRSVVDR